MSKEELLVLLNTHNVGQAVDELGRLVEDYPYFHTGHQLYIKSLQQTDLKKMDEQLNKAALIVRDRTVLFNYLNSTISVVEEYAGKAEELVSEADNSMNDTISESCPDKGRGIKILSPADLIDSFLKADPRIVPNDKTYNIDLSENIEENKNFCTETLADIYAMQGHKNKAIEIYEQLILKYPEKNIYFAAQIKRLKE